MHQFQPLSGRELQNVIEQQWVQLELDTRTHEPPTDATVFNAIARITGGNFRLVNRLLAEIERVLAVNQLTTVTTEVGATWCLNAVECTVRRPSIGFGVGG